MIWILSLNHYINHISRHFLIQLVSANCFLLLLCVSTCDKIFKVNRKIKDKDELNLIHYFFYTNSLIFCHFCFSCLFLLYFSKLFLSWNFHGINSQLHNIFISSSSSSVLLLFVCFLYMKEREMVLEFFNWKNCLLIDHI